MIVPIHPDNPEPRKISQAVEVLRSGGLIIFPTDTVYAIGCDLNNLRSIEKLCKVIGKKPERANLSLICADLSDLSAYSAPINSAIFKLMKASLPGPYTFILKSSRLVPKLFQTNKKTVGIRVPDNAIVQALIKEFGSPLVSASVHSEDIIEDYLTDPELIYEQFQSKIEMLIDGGNGGNEPSTIIDCTEGYAVLVREGKGAVDLIEG